jgi:hypothetical protein
MRNRVFIPATALVVAEILADGASAVIQRFEVR